MEKKSTVRSAIFKKSGSGQHGEYHIFEITFDNGDKGDYVSKSKEQTTFKEGTETPYNIDTVVNGNYTNYKIKPIQSGNGFVPGKGNPSYEHKRVALKCAVDLAAAGKIGNEKISEYAGSFMKFLNE